MPNLTVKVHIPLEQGLRLAYVFRLFHSLRRQSAYSIRTRIKTFAADNTAASLLNVKVHIPLEQGLRRPACNHPFQHISHSAYSIRTRIKTSHCSLGYEILNGQSAYSIRTRIKTTPISGKAEISISQSAYSIRTRIKTITDFIY